MLKRISFPLTILVIAVSQLFAQGTTWRVDKTHSSVKFTVSHLVISEVNGIFKDFDVTLVNTKDDFTDAKLTATIQVASIFTDNDRRDGHLKGPEFLDATKYPTIVFKSTSFTKTAENTYQIAGELTIRDVTKPVVLDAVYKGKVSAWGKTIISFTANTEINRFDYGVKWDAKMDDGGLVAGEKVRISLSFEGQEQKAGG